MKDPRSVLQWFDPRYEITKRVRRGRNTHWVARGKGHRVVLRRYAAGCTRREVDYELRVVRHLSERGWPVPVPIAEPLESANHIWCLFRYLPGRSPAPRSRAGAEREQRARGAMLARLHANLADLRCMGQREGWRRADEGLFVRDGRPPARNVLQQYARSEPEGGRILLAYDDRARERLEALLPHAPAPIVVHGDVAPWNMRYAGGRLTALFDFDLAHLDLRVADFALSWRGKYEGVLQGYEAESPLEAVEHELLVPVYWAWMIAGAVSDIEDGNGNPAWSIAHLLRQPHDR